MNRPHFAPHGRPIATVLLIAVLAVGIVPVPAAAVAPTGWPPATVSAPGSEPAPATSSADRAAVSEVGRPEPSVVYEQAMAHAADPNTFTAGDRVSTPFSPRSTDHWAVNGHAPTSLPAGRMSGRDMAHSPQGSSWAWSASDPSPLAPIATPPPIEPSSAPFDADGRGTPVQASSASWTAPATATTDAAAAAGLRRQVFGFLPYWEVSGSASTLHYDDLSTIAYFSVGADKLGNLLKKNSDGSTTTGWGGWTSSSLTQTINAAHSHGTRVVLTLSVFAWTTGQAAVQQALLGSSTARLNLAKQAVAAVRDRGADGINLDFEPLVSGYDDEFVALLRTIRSELDKVASGYQLTYDTTGWIGNYPLEASVAAGAADAIFVMGYDYRTSSSSYVGSIDPLSGPAYDLADTVRSYTARVSPSKVILGLPWYGRAWSTATDTVNAASQSGAKYGYSTAVNYENIVALVAQYGRRWDSREQTPWFAYQKQNCTTTYGCVTSWRQVYYDDYASMRLRYDLVNTYGLRGAGIWALGYDGGHPELYQAITDAFLTDKTGPVTGIRMLNATQRDEGFTVSWAGTDATGVASYDVQVSTDGGAWTDWLLGTTATSGTWLGQDGHGYAFRTRGRDTKGNVSAWNVTATWSAAPALAVGKFGQVRTNGLSYRTGPDTSATKLGTVNTGTVVAVTGGPITADGYVWWQVTQPVLEWGTVTFAEAGVWMASGPSASPTDYVAPFRAPNSTTVQAGIRGYGFNGRGAASLGVANAGIRFVSPNGDGDHDTVRLDWETTVALSVLQLRVYRADGRLMDTRTLTAGATGAGHYAWDAKVAGVPVADGTYVLQLVGTSGPVTYTAPSASPVSPAQLAAFGVTVQHLVVSRLFGQTLYDTSAAISAASFGSNVPVVFIATGTRFPDALTGAPVAGKLGAPLLLTDPNTLPPVIAAELTRLKPAKIVILGGPGAVSDAVLAALRRYAGTVSRLFGQTLYDTSAAISAASFGSNVPVVFIATGTRFPDALTGAPVAGKLGAPLLLTDPNTLPPVIAAELTRLKPAKIVILGGPGAVSDAVLVALRRYAGTVSRLFGQTLYDTSAAISAASFGSNVPVVFIATGTRFPDALTGAPVAGKLGAPLLLTDPNTLPPVIAAELTRLKPAKIVILGGPGAVSDAVLAALRALP